MTRIDASIETKVGANPSDTKLDGIPQGNPAGIDGPDWLAAMGIVEVTTS